MNLSEMIEAVNRDIDDDIEDSAVISWLNRALDDLTPITQKESIKIAESQPSNTYEIPDDSFEIAFVRVNGREYDYIPINDKDGTGYKVWGDKMFLQPPIDQGFVELFYFKRLNHLTAPEDTPEIDPSFHDLLVLYAIAMSQYADEEPERQVDAMNRYLARKREYESFILSKSNASYEIKMIY